MIQVPLGQMCQEEREYLFNVVKILKPQLVLESGTWKGGGSTLCIVRGLFENKNGMLHTFETHKLFYEEARRYYETSEDFSTHIKLYNQDFIAFVERLTEWSSTDLILLDGGDETPDGQFKLSMNMYPENSENLKSFKIIEQKCKTGTHVLLHDWTTGRGSFIRTYLEDKNYSGWKLVHLVSSQVGLAHIVKT